MTEYENIQSIGVELEGGINNGELLNVQKWIAEQKLTTHFDYSGDGSVSVSGKEHYNIELRFWHTSTDKMLEFIKVVYANGFKTNNSCGFHIHIKFRDMDKALALLSFKKIQHKFFKQYENLANKMKAEKQKAKYLARMRNHFCRARYSEPNVIISLHGGGDRYMAINFCSFHQHKTIEFRIMPHQTSTTEAKHSLLWMARTLNKLMRTKKCALMSESIKLNKENAQNEPIEISVPNRRMI